MKLLTITIPCYNSQDYMVHAIESLLPGGEEVEILIIDDGSSDRTAEIADDYARRYPGIVYSIHKENGGHGDAVMTGLRLASGLYFKVVDSDDWADAEAYPKVLETLRKFLLDPLDMMICNYIYDKSGSRHRHTMRYVHTLPKDHVFHWEEIRPFRKGQYMLMHSIIYRTQMLKDSDLKLPKHTFYVDELFAYLPLRNSHRLYYLDVDFYHYFIGRADQSVQENIMISRINQALLVNRLLISQIDPYSITEIHKRNYMLNYLEIVTAVSSVLLIKSGMDENLKKKNDLWAYIKQENPQIYQTLRHRMMGRLLHLPGQLGRKITIAGYEICRKIFGFN